MRTTKEKLKKIIKEELLKEAYASQTPGDPSYIKHTDLVANYYDRTEELSDAMEKFAHAMAQVEKHDGGTVESITDSITEELAKQFNMFIEDEIPNVANRIFKDEEQGE